MRSPSPSRRLISLRQFVFRRSPNSGQVDSSARLGREHGASDERRADFAVHGHGGCRRRRACAADQPSKKLTPRSSRLPKNFVHRVPSTCIAIASYIRMTSTHSDLIYLTVEGVWVRRGGRKPAMPCQFTIKRLVLERASAVPWRPLARGLPVACCKVLPKLCRLRFPSAGRSNARSHC